MTKASENQFPSILAVHTSNASISNASPWNAKRLFFDADGTLKTKDSAGSVATVGGGDVSTDAIFDAKGDLAVGTGADTAAKLTVGTNGKVVTAASGESTGLKYAYPPGYEWDYVQKTTDTNITSTTEASSDTIVTSNATTFDGEAVIAEFFCPRLNHPAADDVAVIISLWEGGTELGRLGVLLADTSTNVPVLLRYRFTPSAASHTYVAKAHVGSGTAVAHAGSGGVAGELPVYLRFTKV